MSLLHALKKAGLVSPDKAQQVEHEKQTAEKQAAQEQHERLSAQKSKRENGQEKGE